LTQDGKNILPHIEAILNEERMLVDYHRNISEISGTLKVGMPDFLLCYGMTPVLTEFKKQAPNVELIIPCLNCVSIRDNVINGSLDMGIHCNIGGYPSSVHQEPYRSYRAVLVCSPDFSVHEQDFITPHQRKKVNLITSDATSLHQRRLLTYLEQKDIFIENHTTFGSLDAAKISVIHNLGIAYLPAFTVTQELEEGVLARIPTELDDIEVPVLCSYHKNKCITPAMQLFKNLLFQI
jgi:DNA-binding transcriptional LysR family regulator